MTSIPSTIKSRKRVAVYWLTGIILTLVFAGLHGHEWRGDAYLHTHMEVIATVLAAFVGIMALIRFYSRKDNTFLLIGAGFIGTAFLDGHHTIVTSEFFQPFMPSDLPSLIPWSWVASRQFLSVMLFLSFLAWVREERLGMQGRVRESTVYLFTIVFTLLSFLFFAFVPLPAAYFPYLAFHRPEELVPALFFLLALIGYLKKGHWRHDAFEHWLILSLIVGLIGQAVFMSHSGQLFDYEFDVAHLLKKASYICVLVGLLVNMFSIFRRVEENEGQFRSAVESLQEGFALYNADDRLVLYNEEFIRLHSEVQDILKPGLPFEDLIRTSVQRGQLSEAIGREEEFIQERLSQHRNPQDTMLFRQLTDDTWYIINEARTPDGGLAVTQTDITELKGAEGALRETAALMRQMLEASPVGVLIATREGDHLFANERALEIQGVTREVLFGSNAGSYYADHDLRAKLKENLYRTGVTPPTEVELVKPDGEHFFVVLSSTVTEFEGRKAHLTYMYDITERKQAEGALQESEARLKAIIDSIPALVSLKDRDGRYVMTNRHHQEFLGLHGDFSIGKTSTIVSKEHGNRVQKLDSKIIKTGESYPPYDYKLKDSKGRERYMLTSKVPLRGLSDEIIGIVTTSIDITKRKRMEEELRDSETRTRAIVDNVIDGIITIDERGIIHTANPAAEQIFGFSEKEMKGQNVSFLAAEPYRSAHDRYLANYLTTGEKKTIGQVREVEGQHRDGRRFPMELAVSEIGIGDDRMFVGIVRDITARKEMDRIKGEFISTVSHELRTPLTSIRGSLGLIIGGAAGKIPDEAQVLVEVAGKNTERLIGLVNDILDMEKIESGVLKFRFGAVNLVKLLRLSIDVNKGYADECGMEFVLSDAPNGLKVRGDHDRLMQVMANLLSNAAKFSPKGGRVEVSLSERNGSAHIEVSDHGEGIPEEFQENVFAKFTQADASDARKVGGTGLGLNISRTIIDKHGGTIGFNTEEGKGSTFYFDLPLLEKYAEDAGALPASIQQGSRILICEDDKDIADILSMMLKKNGFLADVAYSAAQAQTLLADHDYDAMTLDLVLPDEDGIDLFRSLRENEKTRDLPIIVISAVADSRRHELQNGDAIGIVDWMVKPIDENRLLRSIASSMPKVSAGKQRILYVEDDPDLITIISNLLTTVADVKVARTIQEGREYLQNERFDLVLLDVGMPDGSGIELLHLLKKNGDDATPVIIFSADEVGPEIAAEVSAVLVKSSTSNDQLLDTIRACIQAAPPLS